MTRRQVLDLITALYNICLFLSPPVPAPFTAWCPHPHAITAWLCGLEHEAKAWSHFIKTMAEHWGADCGRWKELGLTASPTRTEIGSIIIQYNGPGPLSTLSDSQTDHRLTV